MLSNTVTVSIDIFAPIEKIWDLWTNPKHIVNWNFASDDWFCPRAKNDLKIWWEFSSTMSAKDWSSSFDFQWFYTDITENEFIEYTIADGRKVQVKFMNMWKFIKLTEKFEIESQNSKELQKAGWHAILENFKKYVEDN